MAAKRHTETKTYLKDALARLLLEKRFEDITVSDLTQTAGINRGTFYLYFTDKYDMMEQFKCDILDDMFALLKCNFDNELKTRQVLEQGLEYLKEHFDFIYAVSKSSYVNFPQTIKDFSHHYLLQMNHYDREPITEHYHLPADYAMEVHLAIIESIISHWVANGGKESPKEVTNIILQALRLY